MAEETATITTTAAAAFSSCSSSSATASSSSPASPPPAPFIKLFGTNITMVPTTKKGDEPATSEKPQASGLACPRCKSRETKFCYFNNYNVNQPRHYCRGCQRYWTAGGALRNVPVGAGRRKGRSPPRDGASPLALDQPLLFPAKRPNTGIH